MKDTEMRISHHAAPLPRTAAFSSDGDVYAIADRDTDEAKALTTYLWYWDSLATLVTRAYGTDPYQGILAALKPASTKRAQTGRMPEAAQIRAQLLNAWNSELGLYLVDPEDPRLQAANQWNSVYAYYATSHAALAWLAARDSATPSQHRSLLRALACQVTTGRIFPIPWSLACTGVDPPSWVGFPRPPQPCHNLSSTADPLDRVALLLKTTRRKRRDELVQDARCRSRLRRAPPGERTRQDRHLEPTTVFDFLWRTRTRANYGDPSMFYMGTVTQSRSAAYLRAVQRFTCATMFVFEALVANRVPDLLREAAEDFIGQDRSRLSKVVLVPRLHALNLT